MIAAMDAELLDLARTVDLTVLGARVKSARVAKRLTQTEVAGPEMSTAYVSRIESGQRRPDPELLQVIASRVGVGLDQLVMGTTRDKVAEVRLALVSAEVEVKTGDSAGALRRIDETLMDLAGQGQAALQLEALRLKATALEASGRLDEAIILLEDLAEQAERDSLWVRDLATLCRSYRVSGDLERSIETGERALQGIKDHALLGTDEATALMLSLAASYFEHGEIAIAVRMCRRAIDQAEALDSPGAKGIAYWSASIMESRRDHPEAALALARKAIAYIEVGEDHLRRATVRSQLGILQLRGDSPQPLEALANLQQAGTELTATDAGPTTLAANRVAQARALLMLGRTSEARTIIDEVGATAESAPLVAADALVLTGQLAMREHDLPAARAAYRDAVVCLTGVGADRKAAQLWFELGSLFEGLGEVDAAMDAFRRAGASTGLTSINSTSASGVDDPAVLPVVSSSTS